MASGGEDSAVAALRAELARRDAAYEEATGVPSNRAAIAADAEWEALFHKLKDLERAAAEKLRVPGGCGFYIPKRRRFCASMATKGAGGFCSLHAKGAAAPPPGCLSGGTTVTAQETAPAATATPLQPPPGGDEGGDAAEGALRKKKNLKRRMKAMTNPQAQQHQTAVPPPNFPAVFKNPSLPLVMDVGCAKGRFLHGLAEKNAAAGPRPPLPGAGACNFLGLEIYEPLVVEANKIASAAGLENIHFVACNANVSLPTWPAPLPNLKFVSVLFPDPWSRGRHAARRVVTADSVKHLAALLPPGGSVYCCSDVRPLAAEMQALFLADPALFQWDEALYAQLGEMHDAPPPPPSSDAGAKRATPDPDSPEPTGTTNKRVCMSTATDDPPAGNATTKTTTPTAFEHVFPAHQYAWDAQQDVDAAAPAAEESRDDDDAVGGGVDAGAFLQTTRRMRWLAANPYGVPTERDLVCETKWRPVYRFAVRRV